MFDILFTAGITTCELCNKPAYRRDPDMGYLLCRRCFAQFNVAPEPALQFDNGEYDD
jgi:hypothetical protein